MKKLVASLLVSAGIVCPALAERYSVVKTTDMFGEVEFEVMDSAAYAALQKAVKEEVSAFPRALAECKKEWATNKTEKAAFPGTRIKPRQIQKFQPDFMDKAKAEAKKAKMEERETDRQDIQAEREAGKLKRMRGEKKDEYIRKEEAKKELLKRAVRMVVKKMNAKLGREIPCIGLDMIEEPLGGKPDKKAGKKAGKKKGKK